MEDWDQETLEKAIARECGICPAAVLHLLPACRRTLCWPWHLLGLWTLH